MSDISSIDLQRLPSQRPHYGPTLYADDVCVMSMFIYIQQFNMTLYMDL